MNCTGTDVPCLGHVMCCRDVELCTMNVNRGSVGQLHIRNTFIALKKSLFLDPQGNIEVGLK
jgi:hypothetical protein